MGHSVKLIPAQHVKPFTRGNKTDANDALAIIEASNRPNLRFVPIKTTHQQDIQSLHRIRDRLVSNRTGLTNQIRGLLAEYGIVSKKGKKGFLLALQLGLNDDNLSELVKTELRFALDELQQTSAHITKIEACLRAYVDSNEDCRILFSMPGIGVINASAIECKYGNGSQFSKSESLSVSLGLTPKLSSSGLRHQMQGISKRGDPYLRKQLIHGARALLMFCDKRPDDALCRWASRIKKRRGDNIAVVAVANRLARLAWVLLQKREMYRPMPV
jgi:transposase